MKTKKNAAKYVNRVMELFLPWSPVVGGNVFNLANGSITTQPLAGQPIALAASIDKPILLGTNKNEGLLFTDLGQTTITSADQLKGLAKGIFGIGWLGYPSREAKKVLKHYPPTDSSKNYTDPAIQILADYGFTCANQYLAQQVAAAGQQVWAYQFNEKSAFYPGHGAALECCSQGQSCSKAYCSLGGACGETNAYCCLGTACHAAELPYVFADTSLFSGWTGDQKTMAADVATYWGTFVTNPQDGPNKSPLPNWTPFTTLSNYLLVNTDKTGFFVSGGLETSMADAPAIDCSLFTPCYGSGFPDCSN
jgi:carboxylesterase type B